MIFTFFLFIISLLFEIVVKDIMCYMGTSCLPYECFIFNCTINLTVRVYFKFIIIIIIKFL